MVRSAVVLHDLEEVEKMEGKEQGCSKNTVIIFKKSGYNSQCWQRDGNMFASG